MGLVKVDADLIHLHRGMKWGLLYRTDGFLKRIVFFVMINDSDGGYSELNWVLLKKKIINSICSVVLFTFIEGVF